jgi:hypothetical protein
VVAGLRAARLAAMAPRAGSGGWCEQWGNCNYSHRLTLYYLVFS